MVPITLSWFVWVVVNFPGHILVGSIFGRISDKGPLSHPRYNQINVFLVGAVQPRSCNQVITVIPSQFPRDGVESRDEDFRYIFYGEQPPDLNKGVKLLMFTHFTENILGQ